MDLDQILDPDRLKQVWSERRPDAGAVAAGAVAAAMDTPAALPAAPAAPGTAGAPAVESLDALQGATAPGPVDPRPGVHLDALQQEVDRLFGRSRRAHVALQGQMAVLRAGMAPAGMVPAASVGEAGDGMIDLVLDAAIDAALDDMEDLLEAFLYAGPWSARAGTAETGGTGA